MLIDAAVENPTLSHGENSINCDNGLKDFLQKLEMMNLLEKFENELVTLDMLKEMNHEDLKSIGIITFGHRHKILKEIMSYRPPNIVETIVNSAEFQFGCVNCEENFNTHDALRDHTEICIPVTSHSKYNGGNLYENNHFRMSMISMEDSVAVDHVRAESTRINETLSVSQFHDFDDIVDLPSRKRKFGECDRTNLKCLKYRFYN